MLISKKTNCFKRCGGTLNRTIQANNRWVYAWDDCSNPKCGARKTTLLMLHGKHDKFVVRPGDLCGSVSYSK